MKKLILILIKFYQKFISPMFPPSCRYTPTCSQYTLEPVEQYEPINGLFLGFKRILRCNPFFPGGEDPVP